MKQVLTCGAMIFATVILIGLASPSAAEDDFRDRVAPIFQRRCLSCHNDDEPQGGFSLQTADAAFADGYIEAGDADASYLVDVLTPVAGQAKMPKNADPLPAEEIATVQAWIDNGATWPPGFALEPPSITNFDWWSYQPIVRPAVPLVDSPWIRTPIDAFILDRLDQKRLSHADAADRRTLIRRVTYDLVGLPPTPEQVNAFVNDRSPEAYERLVDQLLASKHYGERWARHWLDVVKYADTCGYDKDKLRPNAWPYRDYVIRSFNDDKPYAKFIQEQIAGDVLYPGTSDGILGLGFIAAGPWDFIGHVEVPESKIDGKVARNLDRDDMVSNAINTFCSVTVQCARCHNHKFDPITQEHYYGLQAVFAAVDRAERTYDLDPDIERRRRTLETKLQSLQTDLNAIRKEMAAAGGTRLVALDNEIGELQTAAALKKAPESGYHSAIANAPDLAKWVQVDLGETIDVSRIVLRPCHDDFAGIGAGFGFPVRFKVGIAVDAANWVTVRDQTQQDYPNPNLAPVEIEEVDGRVRYIRMTATKLAERKNDWIFALAELEVFDRAGRNRALGAAVTSLDSIEAPARWGRENLTDGRWPQAIDPQAAEKLAAAVRERTEILTRIQTPKRTERREALEQSIRTTQEQIGSLPRGRMVYAAATHFKPQSNFKPTQGALRPIHTLHRGDVQQPRAPAVPGVLPLDADSQWQIASDLSESERRAALARWLSDGQHPLVWRSIVNRVWQYHFGQGIVATPNDFGRMGAQPTHPKLLDWLASEFRDGGQSLKALHRLIVTSSVYRQSSRGSEANAAIDGSNQYLWRMNRRRLEAEEIRDSILAVSGALKLEIGGPGFYLFELEKAAHSPHYQYHKFDPRDPASHRRSIYRFIVRSQPDPWMTTLDCADSSQSTPRRDETLTALQALSLLNSQFNLVMAERFAERLLAAAKTLPEQVELAMFLVAQRELDRSERDEMIAYAQSHGLPNLCRLLFNLNEFVYVD